MSRPTVLLVNAGAPSALCDDLCRGVEFEFDVTRPVVNLCRKNGELDFEPGLAEALSGERSIEVTILLSNDLDDAQESVRAIRKSLPKSLILLLLDCEEASLLHNVLSVGVEDFVLPPFRKVDVLARLWRLVGRKSDDVQSTLQRLKEKLGLQQLIGSSPVFLDAIKRIPVYAKYDGTVLIQGETGTGKEVVARAVHHLGPRAGGPFVPVNCGAIPTQLMENELFGHERGAFTGAENSRPGLMHEAEGGTLFLDEIDCLPPLAQVKLLRLLQEREYRPIGSTRSLTANVRVIAATNADVELSVGQKTIREDLYYRLNVLPLTLPPLRERCYDVVLLARHFLIKYARRIRSSVPALSPVAIQTLLDHDWPGNVRELEHVVERALLFSEERMLINETDLQLGHSAREPFSFQQAKAKAVSAFEVSYIERMLIAHRGNISRAAVAAKKNRRAFWELMRKHGIRAESYRTSKT